MIGGGNIFRGVSGAAARHGARPGRLYGHAGDGDERAGHAERAGEARRADPGAVGHPDGHRSASPISAAAPSATWKRAGW